MVYIHKSGFPYKKYTTTYHLIADTIDELHLFAKKIGLKKCWYQARSYPHYDIFGQPALKAIQLGAKEISNNEIANKIKDGRLRDD